MKINQQRQRTNWLMAGGAGLFLLLAGGATTEASPKTETKATTEAKSEASPKGKTKVKTKAASEQAESPIFFPMPPDPPRVQFLVAFSSSDDLPRGKRSKFSSFVTGAAPPPQMIMKPYGLAIHKGKMAVTDTIVNTIHMIDMEKWKMRAFSPKGEALIRVPINVTIDENGTHYVADTGRNQVVIFDADEKYVGAIGGLGEMKPTDVAVSADRLYVTDLKGHTVRVYDKKGRNLLFTIPRGAITETNQLFSPTNLTLDTKGQIYVSDTGGFRVLKFDAEGNYLRTFAKHGGDPGTLARPKGVAVDREGRVYVVDAATQVLQMWDAEGRLLLFFGEPGVSAVELNIPSKVVVDYDHVAQFQKFAAPGFKIEHLIFVVNQYGGQKVSVFGFGSRQP